MLKSLRNLAIVALAVAGLAVATSARADNVDNVNLTYASGATFTGTVDFANDYSYITGVNGVLSGSSYGNTTIGWVWATSNQSGVTTPDVFGTWLLDGTPDAFSVYIGFSYDYSGAPNLTIANVPASNNTAWNAINYTDALVGGSITSADSSVTPEPGTLLLLGSGLVGLAGMVRQKIGQRG